MEDKKLVELTEAELDAVSGGAINASGKNGSGKTVGSQSQNPNDDPPHPKV